MSNNSCDFLDTKSSSCLFTLGIPIKTSGTEMGNVTHGKALQQLKTTYPDTVSSST